MDCFSPGLVYISFLPWKQEEGRDQPAGLPPPNSCILHFSCIILLLTLSIALLAQTKKPSPPKAEKKPAGPTKVSGKPVTTASGLQYWDIKVGAGAVAGASKKVKVLYTGWLLNGKEFDSSLDASDPIEF